MGLCCVPFAWESTNRQKVHAVLQVGQCVPEHRAASLVNLWSCSAPCDELYGHGRGWKKGKRQGGRYVKPESVPISGRRLLQSCSFSLFHQEKCWPGWIHHWTVFPSIETASYFFPSLPKPRTLRFYEAYTILPHRDITSTPLAGSVYLLPSLTSSPPTIINDVYPRLRIARETIQLSTTTHTLRHSGTEG